MALNNQDYLLQQILSSNTAQDDKLSSMRDLLADFLKEAKKKPSGKNENGNKNGGGRGGGTPDTGSRARDRRRRKDEGNSAYSDLFKNMFGEAKSATSTLLGTSANVSTTVGSVGKSASVLSSSLKMIPGPIGVAAQAFSMVADAGLAVYEYMNAQLEMYNRLNSSGVQLSDGLITLRRGAGSAYASMDEFGTYITNNSQAVAAMNETYGDGVETFGKLLGSMSDLQAQTKMYGVSQEQLANLTARNFKFQKMYGTSEMIRSTDQIKSTDMFVKSMVQLSRSVGKSVDELMQRFDGLSKTVDTRLIATNLENRYGLDKKEAEEVTKGWNEAFASFGDVGKQLNVIAGHRLNMGGVPEEIDNFLTQAIADRIEYAQRRGYKAPEEIRRYLDQFIKENEKTIELEIENMSRAGNTQVSEFLNSLLEGSRLLNTKTEDVNPVIEEFTQTFNNWIGKTFTEPTNKFIADYQLNSAKYFLNLSKETENAWEFTGKATLDAIVGIPDVINQGLWAIQGMFDDLSNWMLGGHADEINAAFNGFMDDLVNLPSNLWNSMMSWWNSSSEEKSQEAQASIGSVYDSVIASFDSLSNMDFDYTDMKTKIMSSFESMKDKISSWWNTAKGWFSGEDPVEEAKKPVQQEPINNNSNPVLQQSKIQETMREQPKVESTPVITKPERVEAATKVQKVDESINSGAPVVNYDETMVSLLSKLSLNSEQQNTLNMQMVNFMRIISENTETQRNS